MTLYDVPKDRIYTKKEMGMSFLHSEATCWTRIQPLPEHVLVAGAVQEVGAGGDVGPIPTAVNILEHEHHHYQSRVNNINHL